MKAEKFLFTLRKQDADKLQTLSLEVFIIRLVPYEYVMIDIFILQYRSIVY